MNKIILSVYFLIVLATCFAEKSDADKLYQKAIEVSLHSDSLTVAIEFAKDALKISKVENNFELATDISRKIGGFYYSKGNYLLALEYTQQSLVFAEKISDIDEQSKSLNNISLIYGKLKDYDKSINYSKRSLLLTNKTDTLKLSKILNNIGLNYLENNQLDSAELYLMKSLEYKKNFSTDSNQSKFLASTYSNLSLLYIKRDDLNKGIFYSNEASKYVQDDYGKIILLNNKANIYIKKNEPDIALEILNQLLEIAENTQYYNQLLDAYQNKYQLHLKMKDTLNALNTMQKFIHLNEIHDISATNDNLKTVEESAFFLENELLIKDLNAKSNRLKVLNRSLLALVFIALSIGFLFVRYVYKNSRKLKQKSEELEDTLRKENEIRTQLDVSLEEVNIHRIELEHQNEEFQNTNFQLEKSYHEYQILFEKSPIPYVKLDSEFNFKQMNSLAESLFHGTANTLNKHELDYFIAHDFQDEFHLFKQKLFSGINAEPIIISLNNSVNQNFFVINCSTYNNQNNEIEILASFIDITEKVFAERELQNLNEHLETMVQERTKELKEAIEHRIDTEQHLFESEAKYFQLAEILPVGIYVTDVEGNLLFCNSKFRRIFKIEGNYTSINVTKFYDDVIDRDLFMSALKVKGRHQSTMSYIINNERRILRDSAVAKHSKTGALESINGVVEDMTESIEKEEQIKLLSLVAEKTNNMVVITDKNGYTEWVNKSFEDLTEFTLEEAIGKKPGEFLQGAETDSEHIKVFSENLKKQIPFSQTILNYTKSGISYYNKVDIDPVFSKDGHLEKFIAIETDVTDIIEFQDKLKESEMQLRAIFDSSIQSYFLLNENYEILAFNKMSNDYVKAVFKKEIEIGESIIPYSTPETIESFKTHVNESFEGEYFSLDVEILRPNLESKWYNSQFIPVRNYRNEIFAVAFVSLDITDKVNAQKIVEKANKELNAIKDKLEEANSLKSIILGNLGHELRTPLNGILGFSRLMKGDLEEGSDEAEMIDHILVSAERLNMTINSLLFLTELESGSYNLNFDFINLNYFCNSVKTTYEDKVISKGLTLNFNLYEKEPLAFCDEYCLHQVLFQLIDNSMKYTYEGEITIETGVVNSSSVTMSFLKVIDTGIGINPDNLDKIFEPFRQGSEGIARNFEGVGIGLTITKKMVDLMRGRIEVESKQGKGTTISVYIPTNKPSEK